jgi:hypothetical protein
VLVLHAEECTTALVRQVDQPAMDGGEVRGQQQGQASGSSRNYADALTYRVEDAGSGSNDSLFNYT